MDKVYLLLLILLRLILIIITGEFMGKRVLVIDMPLDIIMIIMN